MKKDKKGGNQPTERTRRTQLKSSEGKKTMNMGRLSSYRVGGNPSARRTEHHTKPDIVVASCGGP